MKQWFMLGLAAIGAYAVYQWWTKTQASASGQNAHNAPDAANASILSYAGGQGDLATGPLQAGVPAFNGAPVANGHGDQIMAAYHTNAHATLPGESNYQPAFGPDENRGGLEAW